MIEPLPLAVEYNAVPCVGSGACCKRVPCGFGESISEDNKQCKHLEEVEHDGEHPRYTCGIAEEIVKDPSWKFSPAFGAGCCQNLFNEDRQKIIAGMSDMREQLYARYGRYEV